MSQLCLCRTTLRNARLARVLSTSSRSLADQKHKFDIGSSKFSETSAFTGKRMKGKGTPHPIYGYVPDLGDYYDTDKYKAVRAGSMLFSMIITLVYWCILREENDLDFELGKPLWMHVPAFEKQVVEEKMWIAENRGENLEEFQKEIDRIEKVQEEIRKKYYKDKASTVKVPYLDPSKTQGTR